MRYLRCACDVCAPARARRADEGADLVGILLAGRALDAGRDIDAGRARDAQRLGDIAGIEPARQHERNTGIEILAAGPVERLAEAAGPRRLARRAGVEQQPVGDLRVETDRRRGRPAARSAAPSSPAARSACARGDALRRLLAVQLQHVGLERLDHARRARVVGIDRQRDLAGAALHPLAERARGLKAEMARRGRKEHEADQVGAGSSAASSASGVFRPQILTKRDMIGGVLAPFRSQSNPAEIGLMSAASTPAWRPPDPRCAVPTDLNSVISSGACGPWLAAAQLEQVALDVVRQ